MHWHHSDSEEGVRTQSLKELLPKLTPLFKPHWKLFLTSVLLMLVTTAAMLAGPLVLQYLIDQVINPDGSFAGRTDVLLSIAGVYVLIVAAGAGVGYIQAITLFSLGINVISDLKEQLFRHVLYLGLEFHNGLSPGQLISRVESDTETLKQLFSDVAVNLIRNMMLFFGIVVVLFLKNADIAAWVVLIVPVMFAGTFIFVTKMKKWWRAIRTQWAILTGYVTEYVQGIDIIQQFNYEGRARERMNEVNLDKYRKEVPAYFIEYGFWGVFLLGEIVAVIIVIAVGIRGVFIPVGEPGHVSVGMLVLFIEYIRQMFMPIMQLSEQIKFIQSSMVNVERVFSILETERQVDDGPSPAGELAFAHEIRFENVWFAYDKTDKNAEHCTEPGGPDCACVKHGLTPGAEPEFERACNWILKDVSFTINKGDTLALVGASGGGKSTIINLLLRFYDPQRGRILVDGRDIREFPVHAYRGLTGLVLQDIFLFPGSVEDNLRVFNDDVTRGQLEDAAKIARADTIIERLPGAYSGELKERGGNLSVGERQLISFARALTYNPPLLVLDEATSSVDPHTERLVQEALERLLEGRTAVIVAHRLSTIVNADRILLIHQGRIEEAGTHRELLANDGLYAKLCRLQFGDQLSKLETKPEPAEGNGPQDLPGPLAEGTAGGAS